MYYVSFIIFAAAFTIVSAARIFGGQDAAPGQFPFMVALNDEVQYCDGIIIGPNYILTTAHCLIYFSQAAEIYVGSHLNGVDGTSYPIQTTIVHEGFDGWSLINDIGLIHLNSPLQFNDTIQPIEVGGTPISGTTCTVIGWGQTEAEWTPGNLKYLQVTVIDLESCQNLTVNSLNGYHLGTEQICTLGRAGQGVCWGDAGGPLVCDGKVAGIVSYSVGFDCSAEVPDVYTSITAYADWIQQYSQS